MASKSPFTRWLYKHYRSYLNAQKQSGGSCDLWKEKAKADALADPEKSGWDKAGLELLFKACEAVWHFDPAPEQPDLFRVSAIEIERSYAFFDPENPGHYRRVSGRWVTARQVNDDSAIARMKADEAGIAAATKEANAARIMVHVGGAGNQDKLVWDYRDHQTKPAKQKVAVGIDGDEPDDEGSFES